MKKPFKIILFVSLAVNLVFISLQVWARFRVKEFKIYPSLTPKMVNGPLAKKNFFDSLYSIHPSLKNKKYLFINFWHTGHYWSTKTLPIYDTIIQPQRPDVGYLLINDEKPDYSRKVLRDDTAETKNFLFMYHAEDFILAINQELKFRPRRYWYPKYPLNVIVDDKKRVIFFDTVGISGPKFPEDSVHDRETIARIKSALKNLR